MDVVLELGAQWFEQGANPVGSTDDLSRALQNLAINRKKSRPDCADSGQYAYINQQNWTTCGELRQTRCMASKSPRSANVKSITPAVHKVLVLNGPNLNLLGIREPGVYGTTTLAEIEKRLVALGRRSKILVSCLQSNSESELIERIHRARQEGVDYIIINPAAFTHTSVAIRDALAAVKIPFVEVHLSNVFAREPFRHHSYFSDLAVGVISGFGPAGYEAALTFILGVRR